MDLSGNSAFPIFFALSIVLVLLSCTISIQGLQCYVCVNCATPIAKPIDRTNCAEGRNATGCVTGLLYYKGDYSVNRNCLYQDNQNDVEATERCLEGGEVPHRNGRKCFSYKKTWYSDEDIEKYNLCKGAHFVKKQPFGYNSPQLPPAIIPGKHNGSSGRRRRELDGDYNFPLRLSQTYCLCDGDNCNNEHALKESEFPQLQEEDSIKSESVSSFTNVPYIKQILSIFLLKNAIYLVV